MRAVNQESIRDILLGPALLAVEREWGFDFPEYRVVDFLRQAEQVRAAAGFRSLEDFLADLSSGRMPQDVREALAESLVVDESYFFRQREQLDEIAGRLLPVLFETSSRPVRVWSAGCARGEEPYTLAIMTNFFGVPPESLLILGTDLSESNLARARSGRYRSFSLRETPPEVREIYFRADRGEFELDERIRRRVRFVRHNLTSGVNPFGHNQLDVIICRNVLIYMSRERVEKTVRFLISCLAPGGYLVLGPSENILGMDLPLEALPLDAHGIYQVVEPAPRPVAHLPRLRRRKTLGMVELDEDRGAEAPAPVQAEPVRAEAPYDRAAALKSALERSTRLFEMGLSREAQEVLMPFAGSFDADLAAVGMLLHDGTTSELKPVLDRLLTRNPQHVAGYYYSALAALKNRDLEKALAWLRRALYLDPDFVVGHIQSGLILARLERHRESEIALQNAERLLRARRPDEPVPFADGKSADELFRLIRKD